MAKKAAKDVTDSEETSLPEKIIDFVQKNRTSLVGALGVLAVIGISVVGYGKYQKSKELKIEAELYSHRAKLEKLLLVEPPEQEKQKEVGKLPIVKNEKPKFENISSAASQFESAILKNKSSLAATTSAIELAGTYMEYKQFDRAKELLGKISPSSQVLSSLVSNQLATVLFEMGDFKGAISALEKVIKSKDQSFLHPDALLKKGLSYYKLGDHDKALASLEQVAEEFTGKSSADTAEKYIRVLKFKSQAQSSKSEK